MQLSSLKFVSDKREKDFNKLNIYTVEELVRHFPRNFLDLSRITPLSDAYDNDVVLTLCEVLSVEVNRYARRPYVKALCQQNGFMFNVIWFNQMYVANKLERGEYFFYGRVQNRYGTGWTMTNPSLERAQNNRDLKGVLPVYPLSGNLTQKIVRTAMRQALQKVRLTSHIPAPIQKKYQLLPLQTAYEKLHFPQDFDDVSAASARIALEEYFLLISAFKFIKGGRNDVRVNRYDISREQVESFVSRFPFEFTNGQKDAVNDVFKCIKSPHKMNMLLQGDVGSGKTAVALTAIYMAVNCGYQAAMIAPTEVLARQNGELLQKFFPEYNVCTLTGSLTAAEKKELKKQIADGSANIVCGTHAVIQSDVIFKNLAMTVCDEQHRFGVAQRASLSEKGEGCDVLVMSATPIPRTLSLIFYGDLDVTCIKDKPRSRQDISTSIVPQSKYAAMLDYVRAQAAQGNQTYFVCPKIEDDDEGTVMSVTALYEDLQAKMRGVKIALLHGKMKEKEKNEIMRAFKAKEYDCLVSTTVIEVGVDVPDATTMIIYNAERFGLSQLHQLRGRVGRGNKKSYCFLLVGADSEETRERLTVFKNSTDGFEIAEADLKIRGGGDFMGTRQSGRTLSEIKNLKFPVETLFTAKALSDEAFDGGYDLSDLSEIAVKKYKDLSNVTLN